MEAPSVEELHALAKADGAAAVAERVLGLSEEERRALAPELIRLLKGLWREWLRRDDPLDSGSPSATLHALAPAALGCATFAELRDLGHLAAYGWDGGEELAYTVLADRRPPWLQEWAEWYVAEWAGSWPLVRRMVRDGLIERPATDGYVLGMIGHVDARGRDGVLRELLLSDRELLEVEVWRLFEVEGGGEISLAAVDKYMSGEEGGWAGVLKALSDEGVVSRDRLLDASLDALGRDFSSFRVGWYSRFHEALEPAVEERAARVGAYLALLASTIANTVSFALGALAALAKAGSLPATREVVDRLGPALASDRKGTVKKALALLDRVARGDEALRGPAAVAACEALGHEDADVQLRALATIEKGLGPAARERLASFAGTVAPTVRPRVAELLGEAPPDEPAPDPADDVALPPAVTFRVADLPILGLVEPVEPVEELDDLVELLARVVEETADAEDVERALDALSRLCDRRPPDFAERTASLRRRAEAFGTHDPPRVLVRAWAEGEAPPADLPELRLLELAGRVARGEAQPLLSAPTHRGGWIEPATLVERVAAAPPGRHDLIQALCRLAPDGRGPARERAAKLPDGAAKSALLVALGAEAGGAAGGGAVARDGDAVLDEALRAAAHLARDLDDAGPRFALGTRKRWTVPGLAALPDEGPSEELRALVPALDLPAAEHWDDDFFDPVRHDPGELALRRPAGHRALWAEAIAELGASAWGKGDPPLESAHLALALDPDRPLGELGAVAVALGLVRPDASVRAAAVDAAIAAIGDGRLDGALLGDAGRRVVVLIEIGPPRRLAAGLKEVAGESALHAETVRAALERTVALDEPPSDLHALLDVLNELAADAGAAVADPGARRLLGSLKGAGRSAKLAKALLAREGRSRRLPAAVKLAAEARAAREERWAAAR